MSTIRFSLLKDGYAVIRLAADAPVPTWAAAAPQSFVSVTRTLEELSIVAAEHLVPPEAQVERGWRVIKLHGPIPFNQVGILASLVSPLAQRGVSIFALSTYDTDYILIKAAQLEQALAALEQAGHIREM